jgi:hypothetical protein
MTPRVFGLRREPLLGRRKGKRKGPPLETPKLNDDEEAAWFGESAARRLATVVVGEIGLLLPPLVFLQLEIEHRCSPISRFVLISKDQRQS